MIIGINGKIGAGKDTIGSIIQYLTDKNVKGMSFEDWYASNVYSVYQATGKWEIKKYAGKLKQIASLLTGIPVEKFEDQEFKQKHMGLQWKMTYREFLQKLGTEAIRDGLHPNAWVNALFADYKKEGGSEGEERVASDGGYYSTPSYKGQYPNWIVTDMRFPNELEAVEEREGITIRVTRPVKKNKNTPRLHPSETALDNAKFDYEIINDGTMEELVKKVKEILVKEKLI